MQFTVYVQNSIDYSLNTDRPACEGCHDGVADSSHIATERNGVLTPKVTGCTCPVVWTSRIIVALQQQHVHNSVTVRHIFYHLYSNLSTYWLVLWRDGVYVTQSR